VSSRPARTGATSKTLVLAATFVVSVRWLPRGRMEADEDAAAAVPIVPETLVP